MLTLACTNFTIRNNILVNTYNQTSGGSSFALWVASGNTFTSDYNDLYVNSTLPNSYIGHFNSNYRTLSAWQNTGKDLHSYSELPEFIAPDDLHINTLIPTYLESGGTPVTGIYFDFDGEARNLTTPDIGADEFNGIIKIPPALVLTPEAIDFGNINIGQFSDTVSVTVKNQSAQSVTINSISNSLSAFNLLDVPVLPLSLSANDSIWFNVFFNPSAYGVSNDIVTISNSDPNNPNASLSLSGNVLLLGPQFQMFYDKVNSASTYLQKNAIVDSFMTANPVLPFIEDTIAHFIYRGSAQTITIPGDANLWNTNEWSMLKFSGIDLWFKPQTVERDARLEYKFFLNGSNWISDPRNPLHFGVYNNSLLAMPDYVFPPEVEYYPNILHGTSFDTTLYSSQLQNTRYVRIYLPPGYDPASLVTYPVIVFHDGNGWWNDGKANNILDYLIDKKRIQPLIGVFVPPVEREEEYAFNKTNQFEDFITWELMPYIDSRFRTKTDPGARAMTGFSYGGLITTQICYNHPEIFGLAAPFSAAYNPKNREVFNSVVNGPKKDIKWYMEWGTYENEILLDIPMKDSLLSKGYDLIWRQWHQGHTLGSWRDHLDIAFEYFFPGDSVGSPVENEFEIPKSYSLNQNFPNPFNPNTTIRYQIPVRSLVTLKLYDILGREIITLVNEEEAAGNYDIDFNASTLASGVYFYKLQAGDYTSVKKMILLK